MTEPAGACALRSDLQEVAAAVDLLVGCGNVTEVRALGATQNGSGWAGTYFGYFDNSAAVVKAVARLNAKGIYLVPNGVERALLARAANRMKKADRGEATTDSDITERRWLLIDIDPVRPAGISSTDAEHEAAIERGRTIVKQLRARTWPDPIAGDSGNGAHLLYRIQDVPVDDDSLIEQCLKALAHHFGDDVVQIDTTVHNPARIWKLYGTISRKGDHTAERPHRLAKILFTPGELSAVPIRKLHDLASEWPGEDELPRARIGAPPAPFDVAEFIVRHAFDVEGPEPWRGKQGAGRRWIFRRSPMCGHHDGAAYLLEHASGAITAGCQHDSCSWTWRELRAKHEPPANKGGRKTGGSAASAPVSDIEPFKPFPLESLPEPIRSYVEIVSKSIGCDPVFVILPVLAEAAAAIGNARVLELKRGWTEPSILWVVIVGESGTLKSPAIECALKPIQRMQAKALKQFEEELANYETKLNEYEKDLKKWKQSKTSDQPIKPQRPIAARFVVSDVTVESTALILKDAPRGLLLARDELSGWITSFNQYKGGRGADAAAWLEMHRAGTVLVDRKSGESKIIHVPRASVGVAGGIQPQILRAAIGQEHRDNGLLARLLLAMPPRRAKKWTDAEIDEDLEKRLSDLIDKLYKLNANDQDGDPLPEVVLLSVAGKTAWIRFYNEHAQEQADLSGDLAAAWSKLEGYAARLALLFHFVRWATDDPALSEVDADSVNRAVDVTRWFCREARRVYTVLSESDEAREQRRLVDMIHAKGGQVTSRDWQRSRPKLSAKDAKAELQALVDAGIGEWHTPPPGPKGGRPTTWFRLIKKSSTSDDAAEDRVLSVSVSSESKTEQSDWGEM